MIVAIATRERLVVFMIMIFLALIATALALRFTALLGKDTPTVFVLLLSNLHPLGVVQEEPAPPEPLNDQLDARWGRRYRRCCALLVDGCLRRARIATAGVCAATTTARRRRLVAAVRRDFS
jgi:hypothetical protein